MSDQVEQLRSLLTFKQRRLRLLKEQAAQQGYDCPPHITMEIEDLQVEIVDLQRQVMSLPSNLTPGSESESSPEALTAMPVRIFCILTSTCSDTLKGMILRQNQVQALFDIGIAMSWQYWPGRSQAEQALQTLHTNSRLHFCEQFQAAMAAYNQAFDPLPKDGCNLAITTLAFPKNYYTWTTRDRKGIVIGVKSLETLFQQERQLVEKIILRVIQRMLLYSLQTPNLKAHEDTRGCLFDLTRTLTDIRFSVDATRLCATCEAAIRQDRGAWFVAEIKHWLYNTFR
jgi:hypothetical protein